MRKLSFNNSIIIKWQKIRKPMLTIWKLFSIQHQIRSVKIKHQKNFRKHQIWCSSLLLFQTRKRGRCRRDIVRNKRILGVSPWHNFGSWWSLVIAFPWNYNCAWKLLSQKLLWKKIYQGSLSSCSTTCVHWRSKQRFEPGQKINGRGPTRCVGRNFDWGWANNNQVSTYKYVMPFVLKHHPQNVPFSGTSFSE